MSLTLSQLGVNLCESLSISTHSPCNHLISFIIKKGWIFLWISVDVLSFSQYTTNLIPTLFLLIPPCFTCPSSLFHSFSILNSSFFSLFFVLSSSYSSSAIFHNIYLSLFILQFLHLCLSLSDSQFSFLFLLFLSFSILFSSFT